MARRTSEQPLRIAVLAETLNRGGAERQGYLLAEELFRRGHYAKVLSFWAPSKFMSEKSGMALEFPGTPRDYLVPRIFQSVALPYRLLSEKFLKKFQRQWTGTSSKRVIDVQGQAKAKLYTKLLAKIYLGGGGLDYTNLFTELARFGVAPGIKTLLLGRYLQQQQCNLVISFLPDHNAFAILASKAVNIPVVVSERNDFVRQPVSAQVQWARSSLYKHANIITANTEFAVQQITELNPHGQVIWQPNKQYFSLELAQPRKFVSDLYVISRLEPQKRIENAVQALPLLREMGVFPTLHIFGEGSYKRQLGRLVSELGVDAQVHFRGYVPNNEIFGQGLEPGLFLLNSSYEGSSNSLHESVAAGLIPVVSETVSEIHSILRPSLRNLLVTEGTSKDIASKIRDLFQRKNLARQFRNEVVEDFAVYWKKREVAFDQAMNTVIGLARNS